MKGKHLRIYFTCIFVLAFVFGLIPVSSHATPTTEAVFSIIEYDGTFTYAPGYRPAELPPEYRANPPLILPGDRYARDEVILRFKPEVAPAERNALMALHGMRHGRPMWGERAFVTKVAAGSAVTVTRALLRNPLLEIASLNPVLDLDGELNNGSACADGGRAAPAASGARSEEPTCVNDPLAPDQGHLQTINACEAWTYSTGLGPVSKIAIIDSGIDATGDSPTPPPDPVPHPDFAGKFKAENWIAFRPRPEESQYKDKDGHGTLVAGVATANTNNGTGVAGVAYTAWPMSLKIYHQCHDPLPPTDNLVDAIRWAADHGASVINNSGGFYPEDLPNELVEGSIQLIGEAVQYAYDRGLTIVATAGNNSAQRIRYPAALGEVPFGTIGENERLVIGVMGTWCSTCPNVDNEARYRFSNYGLWYDFGAPYLEYGPDEDEDNWILSTAPSEGSCHGGPYARDAGTSYAAPMVAGLAMLLTTMGFSNDEVWNWIRNGAKDLPCDEGAPCPPGQNDPYTGYGRIDAGRSMELAFLEREATGPEMVVVPNAGQRGVQWYNFMAGGLIPDTEVKVCYTMPTDPDDPICMNPPTPYEANEFGIFGIGLQPTGDNPTGIWSVYICQDPPGACTSEREFEVKE